MLDFISVLLLFYVLYYCFCVKSPALYFQSTERNLRILSGCSLLRKPFWPLFLFDCGHFQTILPEILLPVIQRKFRREIVDLPDGGEVSLDWSTMEENQSDRTPTIVILHGLSGNSSSSYLHFLYKELDKKGWRFVVMNARGCGTPLKTPQMFNAGWTEDVRFVGKFLKNKLGEETPLFIVGISLGGNIMTNYLGEEMENTPFVAAVSIANPFNLSAVDETISTVYTNALVRGLKKYLQKNITVLSSVPNLQIDAAQKATTVREFDHHIVVPLSKYKTVQEYYKQASSSLSVANIAIPFLALNSLDDPVLGVHAIPHGVWTKNQNVIFAVTKRGGHPLWLDIFSNEWGSRTAIQFISSCLANFCNTTVISAS